MGMVSERTLEKLYSSSSISILPASILEKSSTSLTRVSNIRPELLTVFAYWSMTSSLFSFKIISFIPRMELIGVRISCDMLAKNFVFASDRSTALCFSSYIFFRSSTCWITTNTSRNARPISMGRSSLFKVINMRTYISAVQNTRNPRKPMTVYLYLLKFPFLISTISIINPVKTRMPSTISIGTSDLLKGCIPVKCSTVQNAVFIEQQIRSIDIILL